MMVLSTIDHEQLKLNPNYKSVLSTQFASLKLRSELAAHLQVMWRITSVI